MTKPVIKSHFICDTCKQPILKAEDGFHIAGNVTLADPNSSPGIFGSSTWLSKVDRGEKIFMDEIPEIALCKVCFCEALNIPLVLHREKSGRVPDNLRNNYNGER